MRKFLFLAAVAAVVLASAGCADVEELAAPTVVTGSVASDPVPSTVAPPGKAAPSASAPVGSTDPERTAINSVDPTTGEAPGRDPMPGLTVVHLDSFGEQTGISVPPASQIVNG